MKIGELIKNSRKKAGITQEKLAEQIGVSTTSIQNWEKGTIPDPGKWATIISTLNLNNEEFTAALTASTLTTPNHAESAVPEADPFPTFLFPEHISEWLQNCRLTSDELELFGWQELIKARKTTVYPAEYLCKMTPFGFMAVEDSLNRKLKDKRSGDHSLNIEPIILQRGKEQASSDNGFDIRTFSVEEYWALCGIVSSGTGYDAEGKWKEHLEQAIPCLQAILNNRGRIAICSGKERTLWYSLFVKDDKVIYPEFTELVTGERPEADALRKAYQRDLELYTEHPSMFDHSPVEPILNATYVVATAAGHAFYDWYMDNIAPNVEPLSIAGCSVEDSRAVVAIDSCLPKISILGTTKENGYSIKKETGIYGGEYPRIKEDAHEYVFDAAGTGETEIVFHAANHQCVAVHITCEDGKVSSMTVSKGKCKEDTGQPSIPLDF